MAIVTNTYERASSKIVKEEVEDKIYLFAREETPIYSDSAKESTGTTNPEWVNDVLADSAANALVEGGALTAAAITAQTKARNYTQIFTKTISVTGTNEATSKYGLKSELAWQKSKKMRELKRDIELAICSNTASVDNVSDTSGRKLGGLESWLETNVSRGTGGANGGYQADTFTDAATDGTQRPLTLDLVLGVARSGYDNGAKFTTIHTGSFNKQRISEMSGNATRTSSDEKAISYAIDIIRTDFGTFSCMINPQMRTRSMFLLDPANIKIKNLRKIGTEKLAKTNDSTEVAIITELTTQVIEKGLGGVFDLTTS